MVTGYSYERAIRKSMWIQNFEKWNSWLRVQKEYREIFLDSSVIANVFLSAKHAGATVLHMQIWTQFFLLLIDDFRTMEQNVFIS